MTKKSFVFSLVLAVAFLVVANVKADMVPGLPTGVEKKFELSFTGNNFTTAISPSVVKGYEESGFEFGITPTTTSPQPYTLTITPPEGLVIGYWLFCFE